MAVDTVSFVIPAHNEEAELGNCIAAIRKSANRLCLKHEIIVSNDDSTDRTPEIARQLADKTVDVQLRNIGAVRNAGAAIAENDLLVFVDADTILPAVTLNKIIQSVNDGALGGGANVRFDQRLDPLRFLLAYTFTTIWLGLFRWAAGCLVYVRRETFEQIGGFDKDYFAAEELFLSREIKRRGKFKIVRKPVLTSARKLRMYGFWEMIFIACNGLFRGPNYWKKKDGLGLLYDARREVGDSDDIQKLSSKLD